MILSRPFSALADTSSSFGFLSGLETYSVVSNSNAVMAVSDSGIMPMSSVGTVTNTVRVGSLRVSFDIADSDGSYYRTESISVPRSSSDNRFHFSYSMGNSFPSNYYILNFIVTFPNGIPSPSGNYSMGFDFTSDTGLVYLSNVMRLRSQYIFQNSTTKTVTTESDIFRVNSGDIYAFWNSLAMRSSYSNIFVYIPLDNNQVRFRDISGSFAINFTPVSSSGSATAGPIISQDDFNSGVSSSISDISSSVGEMSSDIGEMASDMAQATAELQYISNSQNLIIQGIDNVILHISDQLYAFWDQLYNLIHLPEMDMLGQILEAIKAVANNSDISAVVEQIKDSTNTQTEQIIANDNTNTSKVEQAVEKHGNFIIEGLKSLFIPSDDYFSSIFTDLNDFFKDRFGFLYTPIDLLVRFVNLLMSVDGDFSGIPFPELSWDGHVLVEAQTVNFDILQVDAFKQVQQKLYFLTDLMMIGALLALIHRKFEEVMMN